MKYKDATTGEFKELKIRATDELPVGSEIDVDDNTTIPAGWEQTDDKIRLLWENPNKTSDFSAQTITLSNNDYNFLLILYTPNIQVVPDKLNSEIIPKGYGVRTGAIGPDGTGSYREITRTSDISFSVGSGYNANTLQDRRNVPLFIYGF